MRRLAIITALLAGLLAPFAALEASAPASASASSAPRLLAFRGGHFGGFHFGGSGFRRRGFGFGGYGRHRSGRGLLHRIARALAFAYLLHLFFSHGGLSILLWLLVIGLIVLLVRRRRHLRSRYSY